FRNRRSKTFIVIDKSIIDVLNKEFSKELDHLDYISLEKFNKTDKKFHLGSYSFLYLNNFPEKNIKFDFLRKKIEGVEFIRLLDLLEIEFERIPLDHISADWIIQKFTDLRESYLKLTRFINVLVSIIALIIFFPIGFLFSVFNKIFSHGPIFYIQERVGEGGRLFRLFKFRTMRPEAEKNGPIYTASSDKRITAIGRIMRKLRIDEVPQFINVLKGDMNLIGPRPERAIFVEDLTKILPYYNLRHIVKPGLTGWAQVKYSYAGADIKEQKMKFEYDLFYIKNRNLFLDLLILLKTIKSVFLLKGK
ncbi:MAG: sugar transferase, partial [Candidatus Aminicenantes bacterium]|nr:sugar transferase [Candidatus Aminicenantes bacterium]